MLDTPNRLTINSKPLIDHVMQNVKWVGFKNQAEFIDMNDHCPTHVSHPFWLNEHSEKT